MKDKEVLKLVKELIALDKEIKQRLEDLTNLIKTNDYFQPKKRCYIT